MPNITMELLEGRTPEQKQMLAERVTQVVADTLKLDPQIVNITFIDNKRENVAKGGKLLLYR